MFRVGIINKYHYAEFVIKMYAFFIVTDQIKEILLKIYSKSKTEPVNSERCEELADVSAKLLIKYE